jgi:maltose alpha-D-glucosyltransferase/alpha-amylase
MGDNIYLGDRNGVRTPMQWSSDRNAGFSRANPQKLFLPIIIDPEYHYEAINVEAQQNNPHSLLWWMKRLIALRKKHKAFGRGSLEFLHPENRRVLSFVRRYENDTILVVANLSRFVQCVELDLSAFVGMTPVEMFGYSPFPTISDKPYFLTLGPHSFYWFILEQQSGTIQIASSQDLPEVGGTGWDDTLTGRNRTRLESVLGEFIKSKRWFAGKARALKSISMVDTVVVNERSAVTLLAVDYREGDRETYLVPISLIPLAEIDLSREENRSAAIARLSAGEGKMILIDAIFDREFSRNLLDLIGKRKDIDGEEGEIHGVATKAFKRLRGTGPLDPHVSRAEQSNSSVLYGDRLFLKLYRKVETGINTDFEMSRFLTEKTEFPNVPPLAGSLEYRRGKDAITLAILQGFVPSSGDAWSFTLDTLGRYFERLLSERELLAQIDQAVPEESFVELASTVLPPLAAEILGSYVSSATLLAERTAEMHLALASHPEDPVFAPEAFTSHYQRSIYQHMRSQATKTFQALRKKARELPAAFRPEVDGLLAREQEVMARFHEVLERKISALRIRTHGDYHLGQVLYTGRDFVIIDFEGEPGRPLSERRIKRSALRDVAGMLRSFNYAPHAVLLGRVSGLVREEDAPLLDRAARYWHRWISSIFLARYLEVSRTGAIIPATDAELSVLLRAYLLEKALYEVVYEMNNRPDWLGIPLRGILQLLDEGS